MRCFPFAPTFLIQKKTLQLQRLQGLWHQLDFRERRLCGGHLLIPHKMLHKLPLWADVQSLFFFLRAVCKNKDPQNAGQESSRVEPVSAQHFILFFSVLPLTSYYFISIVNVWQNRRQIDPFSSNNCSFSNSIDVIISLLNLNSILELVTAFKGVHYFSF